MNLKLVFQRTLIAGEVGPDSGIVRLDVTDSVGLNVHYPTSIFIRGDQLQVWSRAAFAQGRKAVKFL